MCITPVNISEVGLVACRNCWQCRKNRVNDYVGRAIAESLYSEETWSVTLTYAGGTENPNAVTLVYKDVQDYFKRLRASGHKVRYIVTGEYGSKKGRAHWHAILFMGKPKKLTPTPPTNKNTKEKHWPHGYSYFQKPDYKAFEYVLKYVLKDQAQEVQSSHLSMSKKPILGLAFILSLAEKYVKRGLPPLTTEYSFPDVRDKKGNLRKFRLTGRSREAFLQHFVEQWEKKHPTRPVPYSQLLDEYLDEKVRNWRFEDEEYFNQTMQPPLKYYNPKSYHACPCGGLLSFYEGGRVEYTIEKDGKIWEKELKEPGQILLATTGGLERYIPW